MTYLTTAIVLKNSAFREYDKLVTIYTNSCGKITALARGTLKIKSKLAGHLEPLVRTQVMIARGRYFDILAQSVAESVFPKIRGDFLKTITSAVALEAVDVFTKEGLEDEAVFDHLRLFLEFLEQYPYDSERSDFPAMALAFLVRLFSLLGHRADIQKCCECKRVASDHELSAFDADRSSLLCHICYDKNDAPTVILNNHEISLLNEWQTRGLQSMAQNNVLKISYSQAVISAVQTMVRVLADGKDLRSLEFLLRYCTI